MVPSIPKAVLLDVNGTLFSPASAKEAFRKIGLGGYSIEAWFAAVLRDGFAAQLSGEFRSFKEFGAHHLQALLSAAGNTEASGEDAAQQVIKAWQEAHPYPDVGPGIKALTAAGVQVAALTNGSEGLARSVLAAAGVEPLVSPILDINMAQAWKPAAQSYQYALRVLGHEAHEVMMVASHPWDIHGAMHAGLMGAYVQRSAAEPYPPFLSPQPSLVVNSFTELAAQLQGTDS